MEPEDNILDYRYSYYQDYDMYRRPSGGPTSKKLKGEFKLPESFLLVINKMIPEIHEVSVYEVNSFSGYHNLRIDHNQYMGYDVVENQSFIVTLTLVVDRDKLNIRYTDRITELFEFTYPDYNFVRFDVRLKIKPEPTKLEKFYELFG